MTSSPDSISANIKRSFILGPDQKIELHWGASWVRSKTLQLSPETNDFLNALEHYINGAIIQYYRIKNEIEITHRLQIESTRRTFDFVLGMHQDDDLQNTFDSFGDSAFTLTFLDIYFCIMCLEKVENLSYKRTTDKDIDKKSFFESIEPLFRTATKGQVESFRNIQATFKQALSGINTARNFFEHFVEKVKRGAPPSLSYTTSEEGVVLTFGKPLQSVGLYVPVIDSTYETFIRLLLSLPGHESNHVDSEAI